jgi:hypothetical protein
MRCRTLYFQQCRFNVACRKLKWTSETRGLLMNYIQLAQDKSKLRVFLSAVTKSWAHEMHGSSSPLTELSTTLGLAVLCNKLVTSLAPQLFSWAEKWDGN